MNELQKRYLDLISQSLDYLRQSPGPVLPTKQPSSPTKQVEPQRPKPSGIKEEKVEANKQAQSTAAQKKQKLEAHPQATPKPLRKAPHCTTIEPEKPVKPKANPISLTTLSEPLTLSSSDNFLSFMQRNFPHNRLHKQPHEDRHAKQVRFGWRVRQQMTSVPIIYDQSLAPYRLLLENIAKAITLTFAPSSILNIESLPAASPWQMLEKSAEIKLILAPDTLLSKYPPENLTEDIAGSSKIGPHELLELPDLSLYQKDPLLKRSLWDLLCQKLQKR